MTECLIRSLCCQENMSHELWTGTRLAEKMWCTCGSNVQSTHQIIFVILRKMSMYQYDNKLSVYSLSWTHALDSRSHSSSGLPTSCRRKWLTTFIVHWSSTPFVMSRMNLLAWVNELQCRLILGNVCRFSEEVFVQSQRNFSKIGNFVSLWI